MGTSIISEHAIRQRSIALSPFFRIWIASLILFLLISFSGIADSNEMDNTQSVSIFMLRSADSYKTGTITFIVASAFDFQSYIMNRRENWILLVLGITCSISIFTIHNYFKEIKALFRALINFRITRQIYREQEMTMPTHAFLLSLVFSLSGGIYIYLLLKLLPWELPFSGFPLYVMCVTTLTSVYIGKHLALKWVSFIFPFKQDLDFYNYNVSLTNRLLGLVLLPILLFIAYAQPLYVHIFLILSFIIIVIAFLFRIGRGFIIAREYLRFHKFYFFIYLCTLEIAPALIMVKLLGLK